MAVPASVPLAERRRTPPYNCLPPPPLEVLDEMPDDTPDDITIGEIYRVVAGLRTDVSAQFASLRSEMDRKFDEINRTLDRVVYADVFRAEMAAVNAKIDGVRDEAKSARALSLWALGLIVTSIVAVVGVVLAKLI